MSSMSVKNRVAMFEHVKPESKSPTTPSNNKMVKRQSSVGSHDGHRASWPWPTEENVIPAPGSEQSEADGVRRLSSPSPFTQKAGNSTVPPPYKSPKGAGPVSSSPFKLIQNKDSKSSFPKPSPGKAPSPRAMTPDSKKSTMKVPSPQSGSNTHFPFSGVSSVLDENKAPQLKDESPKSTTGPVSTSPFKSNSKTFSFKPTAGQAASPRPHTKVTVPFTGGSPVLDENKTPQLKDESPKSTAGPVSTSPFRGNAKTFSFKPTTTGQAASPRPQAKETTTVTSEKSKFQPKENLTKDNSSSANSVTEEDNPPVPKDPRAKALLMAKYKNTKAAQGLKTSLNAAKVVMEEEKSSTGSVSDSSRSSLSNKELSSIASRAMTIAKSGTTSSTNPVRSLRKIPSGRKSIDSSTSSGTDEVRKTRAEKMAHVLKRSDSSDVDPAAEAGIRPPSPLRVVRGSRTVSNVSHQQARRALLEVAQKKKEKVVVSKVQPTIIKEKEETAPSPSAPAKPPKQKPQKQKPQKAENKKPTEAVDRLAFKAANVLALKNSSKILAQGPSPLDFEHVATTKDTDNFSSGSSVFSSHSTDSSGKRRKNHPAFAKASQKSSTPSERPNSAGSERPPTNPSGAKPFSEELFSSFRYFKESRPEGSTPESSFDRSGTPLTLTTTFSDNQVIPAPPEVDSKPRHGRPPHPQSAPSPVTARSPKTLREALAEGTSSIIQSFDYAQSSPMHNAENVGHLSVDSGDSPFLEPEESLHSTSERNYNQNYMDTFYAIGQPKYAPARQSFQQQEGGYLSSLSSHTFSTQSMLSASNEHAHFVYGLNNGEGPNPLGDLPYTMSPGPSMRSGHSLAHSIISVSPRGETPKYGAAFDYVLQSPCRMSGIDASPARNGVPAQIDEEENSEPTVGPSVEANNSDEEPSVGPSIEGASEPTMGFSEPTNGFSEPTVGFSVEDPPQPDPETLMNEIVETILPSHSSNTGSDAPPGFIFRDTETEEEDEAIENSIQAKEKGGNPRAGPSNLSSMAEERVNDDDNHTHKSPDPTGGSMCEYTMRDDLFKGKHEGNYLYPAKCAMAQPNRSFPVESEHSMDKDEASFGTELKQGGLKADTALNFGREDKTGSSRVFDRSTSTKATTSTSLRTGLSEVQIDPSRHENTSDLIGEDINVTLSPKEGSTSIRTGLSGIQNPSDIEGSTSIRSVSVSMRSTAMPSNDKADGNYDDDIFQSQHQHKQVNLPDTIVEDDEEDATKSPSEMKEGSTMIGYQSTATTQTSSGESYPHFSGSGSGARSGSGSGSQTMEGNQTATFTQQTGYSDSAYDSGPSKLALPVRLAPINTRHDKCDEDQSAVSSTSSKSSRWKMKMPNVIKSVLAKASPRHSQTSNVKVEQGERTGFSTSDDEDDDIFGGLEDEVSKMFNEPLLKPAAIARVEKPRTPKQVKQVQGKFFSSGRNLSGHTRKSEPPRIVINKENTTTPRRSVRSEARTAPTANKMTPENKFSTKSLRKSMGSPTATNPNSLYSNDRSGTTVVESEVEHVNSDITSSILGVPGTKQVARSEKGGRKTPKSGNDDPETEEEKAQAKTPKAKTSSSSVPKKTPSSTRSRSSKKSKSSKSESRSRSKSAEKSKSKRRVELEEEIQVQKHEEDETLLLEPEVAEETKDDVPTGSMFMNLGCGLTDAFSAVASVCHFGSKAAAEEEEKEIPMTNLEEIATYGSSGSNHSSSHLTELEKRVWNEWDKLDSTFNKPKAPTPAAAKDEDHDKKRQVARGKLLEIASSAISSQMTKEGEQSGGSASYTTGSSTDSGDTSGMSGSGSGSSSEGQTASSGESTSYLSSTDTGSDLASAGTKEKNTIASTPILLSFSQRSLIEKFSKQLSNVGVEVLKLNRRKQWQVRYFTVSKEQTALIGHESKSKSEGDVARCPKALLWLKKFNAKGAGYGISNIDKNGHGGMLLIDLMDIQVNGTQDLDNPIPKKLSDKFKESALVTLKYKMKGENRSIEFRCKDNDEAQFLCTCMRVIRDLLKREQTLRQKTPTKASQTKTTPKASSQSKALTKAK